MDFREQHILLIPFFKELFEIKSQYKNYKCILSNYVKPVNSDTKNTVEKIDSDTQISMLTTIQKNNYTRF